MLKNRIKDICIRGCLVLTVLLLWGCRRESDLEITVADSQQITQEADGTPFDGDIAQNSSVQGSSGGEISREDTQAEDEEPQALYVQVTGAVRSPGVYELPEGSRVFEAVQKAGGMTDDAAPDSVNQAVQVADGEMIILYTRQEWDEIKKSGDVSGQMQETAAEENDGRVDINTADADLLCTIPGIGQTRAQSIITYREQNGAFGSVEDIKKVSGIKEGLFQKIKDKIKV